MEFLNVRKWFLVWLLVCGALLVGCASDRKMTQSPQLARERCELPVWETGDYWIYELEGGEEFGRQVVAVLNELYVTGSGSGKGRQYGIDRETLEIKGVIGSKDGKLVSSLDSGSPFYRFPLFVGKKWDRMIKGETQRHWEWNYLMSYRVVSFEEVKVQAGTFKAFKIEQRQSELTHGGEVVDYYWFSPEVKNIIKYQFGTSHGGWVIKSQDYELTKYKVKNIGVRS